MLKRGIARAIRYAFRAHIPFRSVSEVGNIAHARAFDRSSRLFSARRTCSSAVWCRAPWPRRRISSSFVHLIRTRAS